MGNNSTTKDQPKTIADLAKVISDNQESLEKRLSAFTEQRNADMQYMRGQITRLDQRFSHTATVRDEDLKDAAKVVLEEEVEEAVEGVKATRTYKVLASIGHELKPGIPNHDHIKGTLVSGTTVVILARTWPAFRDVAINALTP